MKPKRYRTHFIEPGIISYEDIDGGKVFVSKDALDQMLPTFVGAPVINETHRDISAEEAFDRRNEKPEDWADGIVGSVGYDEERGWYWADMLVWDDDTVANIDANGYSVSCAYIPSKVDGEGTYHGIDYDEEVLDGQYTHMAIVDSPRYEGATIRQNAKRRQPMKFRFPGQKAKENATEEMPEDAVIVLDDDTEMPLAEAVNMYRESKNQEAEKATRLNADDEVEIDGETVKVSELMAMMKDTGEEPEEPAENAEKPTDEAAEDVVDQKENMTKVRKAVQNAESYKPDIETRDERLKRGKTRYSKTVAQGGKA